MIAGESNMCFRTHASLARFAMILEKAAKRDLFTMDGNGRVRA